MVACPDDDILGREVVDKDLATPSSRRNDPGRHRDSAPDIPDPYGAKWPKAVAKITDDTEELLAFYDFPAEHWIHLRTTNPIESTFSAVNSPHQGHPRRWQPGRRTTATWRPPRSPAA